MINVFFGGEIRDGRKGVEYSIKPRFSLGATGEQGWDDVKGMIIRTLGYSESEYDLNISIRVNVGSLTGRHYELVEIVCDQGWRMIYEQTMTSGTQYRVIDFYTELVPRVREMQLQLYVDSVVPETQPEPRPTRYLKGLCVLKVNYFHIFCS